MNKIVLWLPHINAALNLIAACLFAFGYYQIRNKKKILHRRCMIGGLFISSLFMVSYLTYHFQVGYAKFMGVGSVRPIYFTILASHVVLATLIVPLFLLTVFFIWRTRNKLHRAWGRWTLPLSIYVSVSGIVVYLLAFHFSPPTQG